MDVIDKIKQELERGFTKREIEVLMGIPKNNLSGILKGQKKISAKGLIRIQKYFDLETKPEPSEKIEKKKLTKISPEKQKDNKTQASEFKVEKTTTETPNNTPKTLAESEIKMIQTQINDYKLELKNPPKNPTIGLIRWTQIRESNIKELENKLK